MKNIRVTREDRGRWARIAFPIMGVKDGIITVVFSEGTFSMLVPGGDVISNSGGVTVELGSWITEDNTGLSPLNGFEKDRLLQEVRLLP